MPGRKKQPGPSSTKKRASQCEDDRDNNKKKGRKLQKKRRDDKEEKEDAMSQEREIVQRYRTQLLNQANSNQYTQPPPGVHTITPNQTGQMMFATTNDIHSDKKDSSDEEAAPNPSDNESLPMQSVNGATSSAVSDLSHTNGGVVAGSMGGKNAAAKSLLSMGTSKHMMLACPPSDAINMSLTTSDANWIEHARTFVKVHLFKLVKFWKRNLYSGYSLDPNTVCGMFASKYTFGPAVQKPNWWYDKAPLVGTLLTNRRNNVIKTIRKKFLGKLQPLVQCQPDE